MVPGKCNKPPKKRTTNLREWIMEITGLKLRGELMEKLGSEYYNTQVIPGKRKKTLFGHWEIFFEYGNYENGSACYARKKRLFRKDGKYLQTEVCYYDSKGNKKRTINIKEKDKAEIERESKMMPLVDMKIKRLLRETNNTIGWAEKIQNSLVNCFITIDKTGYGFEQRIAYFTMNGPVEISKHIVTDVVMFDQNGKIIKAVKNFPDSESSIKDRFLRTHWLDSAP